MEFQIIFEGRTKTCHGLQVACACRKAIKWYQEESTSYDHLIHMITLCPTEKKIFGKKQFFSIF